MTENKRFTYRYNGDCESEWEIIDLDDDAYYGMDTTENCVKSLVELLNELFEENEQLKQFKEKVFKLIDDNIQIYEDTTTNDEFLQIQLDTKLQTLYNLRKELQE